MTLFFLFSVKTNEMPIWGGMIFWIYLLLLIDWELNDLFTLKKTRVFLI
jgi:hypothetical protein